MHILFNFLDYLFDNNGVHIIGGYLTLVIIDVILGFVKSLLNSRLHSRTYLKGIFIKLLTISGIVVANVIDLSLHYMGMNIQMDISDMYAVGLVAYETMSIIENMKAMGMYTGNLNEASKFIEDKSNKKNKKYKK